VNRLGLWLFIQRERVGRDSSFGFSQCWKGSALAFWTAYRVWVCILGIDEGGKRVNCKPKDGGPTRRLKPTLLRTQTPLAPPNRSTEREIWGYVRVRGDPEPTHPNLGLPVTLPPPSGALLKSARVPTG